MLETHRLDRKILCAIERLGGGTALEIQKEIMRVEVDSPDIRATRRHLQSLCEIGVVHREAVIRGQQAVIFWKTAD